MVAQTPMALRAPRTLAVVAVVQALDPQTFCAQAALAALAL
jgi:hypothetical protein